MIDRSNFSSLQFPWKLAQQRKKFVNWVTLPMHLSTQAINAWSNAMYPKSKKEIDNESK